MTNPNPFSNAERDQLRTYFGYPKLFKSSNAVFENVLDAINGLYDSDGGATQAACRNVMTQIVALEAQLQVLQSLMLASEVTERIKVDAIKNDMYIRTISGPALINQLRIRFSMRPAIDYFARVQMSEAGDNAGRIDISQ